MPLNIRSEEVNQLAEKLAARKRLNKTEAVKQALENELRRLDEALPLYPRRPAASRRARRGQQRVPKTSCSILVFWVFIEPQGDGSSFGNGEASLVHETAANPVARQRTASGPMRCP